MSCNLEEIVENNPDVKEIIETRSKYKKAINSSLVLIVVLGAIALPNMSVNERKIFEINMKEWSNAIEALGMNSNCNFEMK